jgi:uncharacterized membrane protein
MHVTAKPTAEAAEFPSAISASVRPRLESVDLLRGLVMVIMALDHTRIFFSNVTHHPLDLDQTTVALFFTRWITHFCAPVFVFLAGTGACLAGQRGRDKGELSWFLLSRGLWLVFLEVTYVKCFGWEFAIQYNSVGWGVLWAIGWSMVALSALVFTPVWFITAFGLAMIGLHNAFDGVTPDQLERFGPLWRILHAGGGYSRGIQFGAGYPLIPWIGVLATGYGFGKIFEWEPEKRRRWLLRWGCVAIVLFLFARGTNAYGDPLPWTLRRDGSVLWTLLGWLHCEKYPPSLCYLLMTLGPAMIFLAMLDKGTPGWMRPLLVFGRVPLFYYLLHLPLIHALSLAVKAMFFTGSAPTGTRFGFDLPYVYLAWAVTIAILYLPCRWFAALKQRRRDEWLSYL